MSDLLWREALGRVLRHRRHDRGEKLADVAARARVSPQYLSEVERGRKDPSSELLMAILRALELTLLDLTREAGHVLARTPSVATSLALTGTARPAAPTHAHAPGHRPLALAA